MRAYKSYVAFLCSLLMLAPAGLAQDPQIGNDGGPWYARFTRNYTPQYIPPIDVTNSSRLDQLTQAGALYLSLRDAIALALENNVDIEIQRYQFQISEQQLKQSQAGGNGVNFDPVFQSNLNWQRSQRVNSNSFTSGGTATNVTKGQTRNFSISQGFKTGGNLSLNFNNGRSQTNNLNDFYIPSLSTSLSLQGTQPLLNGFGLALNTRGIRVARNNQRLSDFQFQQQINTTLNTVIQAYWNLVSASSNVAVVQQSLDLAQKLYEDNQKQVDIGTLAAIEVVNAQAQVETQKTALVNAQTAVLQQETTLKNLLSRNGIASPLIADVRIVPTDRISIPDVEPVQPVQDLVTQALQSRPELAQQQIQMDNTRINLTGTRNSMLPTLNLTGNVSNPITGGVLNTQEYLPSTGQFVPRDLSRVDQTFAGGYPHMLGLLFSQNLVNYAIGFNLTIPLRNRSAQAQMAQQELQLRQSELQFQRTVNQIRVDVQNAQIAVTQARARYTSAQTARDLQEQVLRAEQQKYQLGASTVYLVVQYQRDLASRRQDEVTAQVAYAQAKLQLDVATGDLMDKYNIVFDEARDGSIQRRPDPIPAVINQQGQATAPGVAKPVVPR